jgi:hypothetical protein
MTEMLTLKEDLMMMASFTDSWVALILAQGIDISRPLRQKRSKERQIIEKYKKEC